MSSTNELDSSRLVVDKRGSVSPEPPLPRRHRLHVDKALEQIDANLSANIDTGATSHSYKFNTSEKV